MMKNYLLLAWKVLLRRKFFTFISLVGISLTLATMLVVAAFIDYHAHPPSPYKKQSRMLFVKTMMGKGKDFTTINEPHYGFHDKYVRTLPGIEAISIQTETTYIAYPNGQKVTLTARQAEASFWDIFDFEFVEGAPFTAEDNAQERLVAVIAERTRQQFFGDKPALGKTITLGDKTYRVIGVVRNVPESFTASGDVWFPVAIGMTAKDKNAIMDEGSGGYMSVILAKSESDLPSIKSEFQAMLPRVQFASNNIQRMYGAANTQFETIFQMFFGFEEDTTIDAQKILSLLLSLGIGFMFLPAINLVNVNMSRILERTSEIGVRKAFGAKASALVGQFIVENLILTLIGGCIGILLAEGILMWITSVGLIAHAVFHINVRIVLYALGMIFVFGLMSGALPAWKMARLPIVQSLKGGINV